MCNALRHIAQYFVFMCMPEHLGYCLARMGDGARVTQQAMCRGVGQASHIMAASVHPAVMGN